MISTPLLGFITKDKRTQVQHDAHARATASFPRFHILNEAVPASPVKVILTDALSNPLVTADTGLTFNGFRQLTGSCVGVSAGNAIATLSAIQRLFATNPTKAMIPWWCFPYGRTRYNEGDRGQGEGAIDSVMAATLIKEGVFSITDVQGLPVFNTSDGLALSSSTEMKYSDGGSSVNTQYLPVAKQFPLGAAAVLNSTADMKSAIVNGYPVLDGCDNYIGSGSVSNGVCLGRYDGRGGHSTCYIGYWDHPDLGPLFGYWNQWAGNTYPEDGSGKPRCATWVKESEAAKLFQTGGSGGETVALSHLNYFPAQPAILSWFA